MNQPLVKYICNLIQRLVQECMCAFIEPVKAWVTQRPHVLSMHSLIACDMERWPEKESGQAETYYYRVTAKTYSVTPFMHNTTTNYRHYNTPEPAKKMSQ